MEGEGTETDTYTYDEKGNVIKKVTTYSTQPDYEYLRNYYYDDDNKLIKEDWGLENHIAYKYDEKGHLKEQVSVDENGNESLLYTYTCDENGNVLTEVQTFGGRTYTNTYKYDSEGHLSKMDYDINGEIMFTYVYEYDIRGYLLKEDVSVETWKFNGYVIHYYQ